MRLSWTGFSLCSDHGVKFLYGSNLPVEIIFLWIRKRFPVRNMQEPEWPKDLPSHVNAEWLLESDPPPELVSICLSIVALVYN